PVLSVKSPSLTPRNRTPSRCATNSRRGPIKINSSLSSPITAISAPVASLRINLSLSFKPARPPGIEKRPRPSETRPEALMRSLCPLRTTSPLFVQPLFEESARTATLIVKKVGGADELTGSERGSLTGGSELVLRLLLLIGGGLFRAMLPSSVAV